MSNDSSENVTDVTRGSDPTAQLVVTVRAGVAAFRTIVAGASTVAEIVRAPTPHSTGAARAAPDVAHPHSRSTNELRQMARPCRQPSTDAEPLPLLERHGDRAMAAEQHVARHLDVIENKIVVTAPHSPTASRCRHVARDVSALGLRTLPCRPTGVPQPTTVAGGIGDSTHVDLPCNCGQRRRQQQVTVGCAGRVGRHPRSQPEHVRSSPPGPRRRF